MVLFQQSFAAPALGADVLADSWIKKSANYRRVCRIGLTGSTAEGDCFFDLYYGSRKVIAQLSVTTEGNDIGFNNSKDIIVVSSKALCKPGEELRLVCTDAANSNEVSVHLDIQDIPPRTMYRMMGRFRGSRRY